MTRRPAGGLGRSNDLLSILVLYALAFSGSLWLATSILAQERGLPSMSDYLGAALLAMVPLTLLAVLIWRARGLAVDALRRAYGARLRIRLAASFLAVGALAALPASVFLGRLLLSALDAPGGDSIRAAVEQGRLLALDQYQVSLDRLERLMTLDAPALAAQAGYEAPRLLAELAKREEGILAIGIYDGNDKELGWAERQAEGLSGPRSGRAEREADVAMLSGSGFLPRESAGGRTRIRYRATVDAERGISAVAMLETDRTLESAAEALETAASDLHAIATFRKRFGVELAWFMAIFILPGGLLALLLGIAAADSIAKPLRALEEAMRRAGEGDLTPRLIVKPRDEIADLIASFNRLLGAVARARDDTAASGKASAWREIARNLAHELKNPLMPIRLSSERVLKRWRADPEAIGEIVEGAMLSIIKETDAMNTLLSEFRDFARLPEPNPDWTDLASLAEEAVAPYRSSYPGVRFVLDTIPADLVLPVDRAQIKRALSNLIQNSVDAMEGSGEIVFRADLVKAADNRYCRLRIRDSGRGISSAIRDRLFQPYVTDKPRGTGLGLAIVDRIVRDHGGRIALESGEGVGTVFAIDLPMDRSQSA